MLQRQPNCQPRCQVTIQPISQQLILPVRWICITYTALIAPTVWMASGDTTFLQLKRTALQKFVFCSRGLYIDRSPVRYPKRCSKHTAQWCAVSVPNSVTHRIAVIHSITESINTSINTTIRSANNIPHKNSNTVDKSTI